MLLIVFLFVTGCGPSSTPAQSTSHVAATATNSTAATAGNTDQATPTPTSVPLLYPIVDTGQGKCYDDTVEIPCPLTGSFYGQDAQYTGLEPSFNSNSDGTITDNNTGLTWQQTPDTDGDGSIKAADKLSYAAAGDYCKNLDLASQDDWRLPDIKSLYSLIDFRGTDPSAAIGSTSAIPFLDSTYFAFAYGDSAAGERTIDAQFVSSSAYVDNKTGAGLMAFGVNFADGRIKAYGLTAANAIEKKFFVLCVRGDSAYGANQFSDNGDGTILDQATGLVWQKADSANGLNWQDALAYCEDLSLAGEGDWRLPDAKSLQSLVDYSRSPSTTLSAAIVPLFSATAITNEAGQADIPFYWTSTTLGDFNGKGTEAVYIAFGRAMGFMNNSWVDVHGAGAQRSDPKKGDPAGFPSGRGPQGDAIRILNYVRCVRAGNVMPTPSGNPPSTRPPLPIEGVTPPIPQPTVGEPGGGDGGLPSQEAIAACSTKTVGDACQFTLPLLGVVNGICTQLIGDQITQLVACLATIP
jgi:hypothetical protein